MVNGNYDFQVRTNYGDVDSDFSDILNYELIRTYPVMNASAEVTENDINLTWESPIDLYSLDNITLIRSLDGGTNSIEVVLDAMTTSYLDENLSNGIYSYEIIANYNSAIQADKIIAIDDVNVINAMPATDLAVEVTGNDITLIWNEPVDTFGLVGYQVFNNYELIATVEENEYLFADQANGDFILSVNSIYTDDLSAMSEPLGYSLVLAYPALNPVINIDGSNILLSWDAPSDTFGLVGYNLYALNADEVNQPQLWVTIDTLVTETSLSDDISELPNGEYRWAVVSVYRNLQTEVTLYSEATVSDIVTENAQEDVAPLTTINGNYPNPFNPETQISFQISKDSYVSMNVFNLKGQLVKSLVNENLKSGSHTITWNGNDDNGRAVASGIYFFRLSNDGVNKIHKCTLMK